MTEKIVIYLGGYKPPVFSVKNLLAHVNKNMDRIRIIKAKVADNLSVELLFSDNTQHTINVGEFIAAHPHPQYNKYLNPEEFKKFVIDDGNIVWGEDWDLIFPLEQLHAGYIA